MADPHFLRCAKALPRTGLLRPRLAPDLEGPASPRLGLAVGPPGAGKTTLLTQWADQCSGHVAWYRSSRLDAKPGRMLACFAGAIATAIQSEPVKSFAALAGAAEQLEHHLYFVVDDFHLLADTWAETELEQLLALNSPNLRFLVGSRRIPRLNLAKSELQTAVTVSGDDLRFRAAEIDQLFRNTYRQPLSPEGVANLSRRTDGWAAALYLFHLATRNRPTLERRRAAESLGTAPRFAQNYLTHHFLAGVSADMERLLRTTCLLDVLTPGRCDALLDGHDSRLLLQGLENLGIITTEDDGATYRIPQVLRQCLIADLGDAELSVHGHLRQRTAAILEHDGAVGAGLQVLAKGKDWASLGDVLRRRGESAVVPGTCEWAALIPENVLLDDAWLALARSRQMVDDGCMAAASTALARVAELTTNRGCLRLARDLRLTASVWAVGGDSPVDGSSGGLRDAIRENPLAVARSLADQCRPEAMLDTGLSFLLAGDQRSALPLLRQSAERLDIEPVSALAAQLALAVFAPNFSGAAPEATATEVDAVQREADRRGYTWLDRLARGVQAALPGTTACQASVVAATQACEARGDAWGAALIAAGAALMRLRNGSADSEVLDAVAVRFRRLSAGTIESWIYAGQALVAATRDLPIAVEQAQTAEAFARKAAVPGALAVAYAAMALQKPEDREDLTLLASQTAQSVGLMCRPWTWFAPSASRLELPGGAKQNPAHDDYHSTNHARRRTPGQPGALLPSLEVSCFGGFALRRNSVAVDLSKIRPQARTLLRVLALNAGRLVHRDRLVSILWADLSPTAARHALQVSVSCLRGALQPDGTAGGQQSLVRQGEAYALVLEAESNFDLADFDRTLQAASAARAARDNFGAADALRRALELYSGEVLPEDGPAEWVADTRERYRARAAEAAASLAGVELQLGNSAAASAAATRSVEIDPWRDESWRTLVETFRRLGDPAAAQRAQQRYDLMLKALGVSPDYEPSGTRSRAHVTGPGTGPQQWPRGRPLVPSKSRW